MLRSYMHSNLQICSSLEMLVRFNRSYCHLEPLRSCVLGMDNVKASACSLKVMALKSKGSGEMES
eukprot:2198946-Amphidinium_carterae.1